MTDNAKTVYKGKKFSVEQRKITLPDGRTPTYDIIVHHGAVVLLAFPTPDEIFFVNQYRPATGGNLLELPAGTIEEGEDPKECAKRELEEECGVKAGKLVKLCAFFASPGVMTEKMHVYVATNLKTTKQNLDEHEVLTVKRMKVAAALELAVKGKIQDGKSLAALLLWKHKNG